MSSLARYEQKIDPLQDNCPVRAAIDVVRGRWKPSILFQLATGAKRFGELQTALGAITAQALTVQLRQLEADGVVSRAVFPEIPPRVEYALTAFGAKLSGVMEQLDAWGTEYLAQRKRAPVVVTCRVPAAGR
ncbi:winged helix-turn-helix transcriptional regulator [Opitutus terrae]|uniref:Transcriptional regulator, HxlR family n=1 Tax=Opitutus terrae (strain DSM 11246 / JCM 15787 / PB90-1) TaxID=452637 RepID=B1ZNM0_OPITP|nr:helix-turn-helix domain-containing protein [Opitutus terrae]ACB74454.1 transcriptional regulator, HxlR family [Opitutus terrae PB90-1]